MRRTPHIARLSGFLRCERGTTLVELAVVLPLFLLVFFALIDFGRLGFSYMMAEKATAIAARIAVVRPPACAGVPAINTRGPVPTGTVPPAYGTACNAGTGICAVPAAVSCAGDTANPTVNEIWPAISILLPKDATAANLRFSYSYDPALGFLGGPYVPMVTVELTTLDFRFVTPLASLAALAGAAPGSGPPQTLTFPPMSVTLSAEDLADGDPG